MVVSAAKLWNASRAIGAWPTRLVHMAALTLLVAWPAWAASDMERQKAAEEIVLAKEAAGRQQFRIAFDHALGAWQLDAENPGYLLDAAAYAVAAGMDERGHELAKQWLGLGQRDRSHDGRARQLLATVGRRKAAVLAKEAAEASKAGDHAGARQKFLAAAKEDPGEAEYLFGAGVEAVAVGDQVAGRRLLTEYLAVAPVGAGNRAEAERLLGQRAQAIATATPSRSTTARDDLATQPAAPRRSKWLLIAGGVVLAAGVGFLASSLYATDEAAALKRAANTNLADWKPYEDRAREHGLAAVVLGGSGLGMGGLGAWWYFNDGPAAGAVDQDRTALESPAIAQGIRRR